MAEQMRPGLGQIDISADSVEQSGIELLLQRCDSLADRRLGYVELVGSTRERTGLGNHSKCPQFVQFHVIYSI